MKIYVIHIILCFLSSFSTTFMYYFIEFYFEYQSICIYIFCVCVAWEGAAITPHCAILYCVMPIKLNLELWCMQSLTIIFNLKSWLNDNKVCNHTYKYPEACFVLGLMYCSPCPSVVSAINTVQLFCFYVFFVSIVAVITHAQGLQMKMI